jgi:hypothetical protein
MLPLLLAALALAAPPRSSAQTVERVGLGDADLDHRLDVLLARGDYLLIARDTLIDREAILAGDVLVLAATFTLEGTITGDLVAVASDVFLRPTAGVAGDVVNAAGGLYRSELATIGGAIVDRPLAPYTVLPRPDGGFTIVGTLSRSPLVLSGLFGFHGGAYDRVDGLTVNWGGAYLLPRLAAAEPRLEFRLDYRTARRRLTGGAALAVERGADTFRAGPDRFTDTNERWIRGDLDNSLTFLWNGKDYRDYHDARQAYVEWVRQHGRRRDGWGVTVRAQVEDARSLRARTPWTIRGVPRPNPPIDDGRIASVSAAGRIGWVGSFSALRTEATVEVAGAAAGGEFPFSRFTLEGDWGMDALADHTLDVEWMFMGPVPGTDSLPRQRWSFVGGSGTLKTFPLASFYGDRVVFVETRYTIPMPERVRLPVLGSPDLVFRHAAGMAWSFGEDRPLEQMIGARLEFFGLNAGFVMDPALRRFRPDVGLAWPFGGGRAWR